MKRCLVILLLALSATAAPPPVSNAEGKAVERVAAFLARNPAANAGTRWTLQTVDSDRIDDIAFRVMYPNGLEQTVRVSDLQAPLPPPQVRSKPSHAAAYIAFAIGALLLLFQRLRAIALFVLLGAIALFFWKRETPAAQPQREQRTAARIVNARDPRTFYEEAMEAGSHEALRTAWSLEPVAREVLVRNPRLLPLLRDARTRAMVSLYATEEPLLRERQLGTRPISLPRDARAFASGGFLAIVVGDATIAIPGGAAIAPPNVRVVPATHWRHEEDAAALREAALLLSNESERTPARIARAADALADHNRWPDVLELTDDITPQAANVAPHLLLLRMRALLRANRIDDARALAASPAIQDAATKLAVADALMNQRAWDDAEKLYRAASAPEQRLRQLALRRKLEAEGIVISTPHFNIRHDPTMNPAIAARIGDLLERELERLRQKLPLAEPRRVTVNVFYWDDFRNDIGGDDHILGLYDGEILFPFGVVQQFKPELVAIITHELTHAVVAQATGDNAPRWFQEGIAQRMELLPQQENAFHDKRPEDTLPISLLEAAMENTIDDVAVAADHYVLSQTFLRYLEQRYGNAVPLLIASFASGRNTEDALTSLTGASLDAISREFRQWGFANSANFVDDEPFPYRDLYSPDVDPRIRSGFRWSNPRKQQQ
jgi:hypothetical protein